MGKDGAYGSHTIHLVNALAGDVVEAVEVVGIGGDTYLVALLPYGDDGLEDGALAFLNPLAHRVEVGGIIDGSGEDAFMLLAFALAVELFPPLCQIVELGVEVDENLNFLTGLIEGVSGDGVGGHWRGAVLLHLGCAFEERADVVAGYGDGEQPHWGEYREAAAHVVGNDESGVALGGGDVKHRQEARRLHAEAAERASIARIGVTHGIRRGEGKRVEHLTALRIGYTLNVGVANLSLIERGGHLIERPRLALRQITLGEEITLSIGDFGLDRESPEAALLIIFHIERHRSGGVAHHGLRPLVAKQRIVKIVPPGLELVTARRQPDSQSYRNK